MVNMANLPQGREFSTEGGVKSIGRGSVKNVSPEHSLVAEILISRGVKGLGNVETRQTDATRSLLGAKVLASGGEELQSSSYRQVSAEKALQAVKAAEMSDNLVRHKGIER